MLVALVLGLHLVLLAGGIALQLPDTARAPASPTTDTITSAANAEPPGTAAAPAPRAQPVHLSTVRWIVPTPVPAPRADPAPRPKPAPKAVHVARPALVPEPLVVAQAAPEPAEAAASTTADMPATASQEVAVNEPLAPVPETPAEPVAAPPDALETPQASEPAATDDTLLAATGDKPRAAAALPPALPPATPPPSTRLHYDVTGNVKGIGYKAQGTLDWTVADGRYEARMEMRVLLLGSRSQASTGRIGPHGLMPERFADKSRSEKAAHFDATQQRITDSQLHVCAGDDSRDPGQWGDDAVFRRGCHHHRRGDGEQVQRVLPADT